MDINNWYNDLNYETIDRYIKEKQEENLNLEFKTISHSNFSSKDDKKNYAKAISGFANSSGGIIIWGVSATKDEDDIDCACDKKEIKPLSQFLSKLNELEGKFVTPIVDGVKHKSIKPKNENEDKGFAVTLVPLSDSGPHMAKAGEDRYYKRSGDSFYKMEHFDIEDMFGRRKKPNLSLYTDIRRASQTGGPQGRKYGCKIVLGIKNGGRASAKFPYLSLIIKEPYNISIWGIDGNKNTGLPLLPQSIESGISQYGGNADIVIHPNTILEVTTIRFDVHENCKKIDDVIIDSEIIAEDFLSLQEHIIIKGANIQDILNL